MTKEEKYFHFIGSQIEGSENGQMFGKLCYKVEKKAFVCFFNQCMVFKLVGVTHQEALSLDGTELFDPSGKGRAMKQWVQVPFEYRDKWKKFAKSSSELLEA